jgi:hypothetical protein
MLATEASHVGLVKGVGRISNELLLDTSYGSVAVWDTVSHVRQSSTLPSLALGRGGNVVNGRRVRGVSIASGSQVPFVEEIDDYCGGVHVVLRNALITHVQ